MNTWVFSIFFCLLLEVLLVRTQAPPYLPRFVTPNEFYYDGTPCSELRPSRVMECPTYGVMINKNPTGDFKAYSQAEIEDMCVSLGFAACPEEQSLFPDGVCRKCPDSHPTMLGDGTGDLYCHNDATGENETYYNPFNCLGSGQIPREVPNSYRACMWSDDNKKVNLEHYYKRDDFIGQLTMEACALNVVGLNKDDPLITKLVRTEDMSKDHGFLQCPKADIEYSFASTGWLLIYIGYSVGFAINILYFFYKSIREDKRLSQKTKAIEPVTREHSLVSDAKIEISDLYKIHQIGYKNDILGTIAWILFWMMSFFIHLFIIAINLDIYGMFFNTLCPASVNEYCNEVGGGYTWRSGFTCSAGCLFSFKHSSGFDNYWPYSDNPLGIDLIYGIICISFFICVIWWITLISFHHKLVYFFSIRCSLQDAYYVVCIKPKEKDIRIEKDNKNFIIYFLSIFEKFSSKFTANDFITEKCKVYRDEGGDLSINFQCIKYTYDPNEDEFRVKHLTVASYKNEISKLGTVGLTSEESYMRLKLVGENTINYDVPTWFQSIWDEFFNMFYLYQFVFLYMWYAFYYWLLALTIHIVVIVAGIISILVKRSSQKMLKSISSKKDIVEVKRDGRWVHLPSQYIVPGDVLKVLPGSQVIADCVLVSGRCVVNESALTGEPAPVPKLTVPDNNELFGKSQEDMKFMLLSATTVESTTRENNEPTSVLVISTGINTRHGQLMRSMLFPPKIRFKFDDHFSFVMFLLISYSILIMIIIAFLMEWILMSIFYALFTVGNVLSPLIPAMFTSSQAYCSQQLKKKGIYCIEINRTFVSAKIKTFCFDKTGTLTKQGMEFHGHSNKKGKGLAYYNGCEHMNFDDRAVLGCCHELEFVVNEEKGDFIQIVGNEVDVAMFEASGYKYIDQDGMSPILEDLETHSKYKVIKRYPFSRDTMMMTSLVQDIETYKCYVYTKGSCERVAGVSKKLTLPDDLIDVNTRYAMKGHYILGIGSKEVESFEGMTRESAEYDLDFIGLLHFKNELKVDTQGVLEHMKEGNIRCVMITGDNIYTACSIAKESSLSTSKRIIIGDVPDNSNMIVWHDASTLEEVSVFSIISQNYKEDIDLAITSSAFNILKTTPIKSFVELYDPFSKILHNMDQNELNNTDSMTFLLPYTRIFARMKPDHKVEAVRFHMQKSITGMCGDGANDAAALRLAHCGIAIATGGGHATIVAPFSSASHSLTVVTDIIRYGRGTLATAIAGYKRLILSGETIVLIKFCMYHASLQLSEMTWIIIDGLINVGMAYAIMQSKPADRLTRYRPTSSLLGLETLTSCFSQCGVIMLTLSISLYILYQQHFFSCKNFDASQVDLEKWWTMSDNYESSVLSICALFLVNNQAFMLNLGFDYRKWWFKNFYVLTYWAFWTAVTLAVLLSPPNFITCLFRINCGDNSLLTQWDKLNIIEYSGLPFVPPGCPCSEQVGYDGSEDYMCENEYINCQAEQYNSLFHHTIFEDNFHLKFLGVYLVSFVVSIFIEWFIIYGPVRKFLRKRKADKMKVTNL